MRHRAVNVPAGQDPLPFVGRVVWNRRRSNGDEVVVRAVGAPVPHARLEVWRGQQQHAVCLAVDELAQVSTALLAVPRALDLRALHGTADAGDPCDPTAPDNDCNGKATMPVVRSSEPDSSDGDNDCNGKGSEVSR